VGADEPAVKPPKAKRSKSAKDASTFGTVGNEEPIGAADSAELIGAFKYHEGGPPTPLAEPLTNEVRVALGRGQGGAQIKGMLGRWDEPPITPGRASADGAYSRMPMSPAELSGLLSPVEALSPGSMMTFDVEELLRIVGSDKKEAVAEVLMSPRGQPLLSLCVSPQTRGPLEALWGFDGPLSAQRTPNSGLGSRWPKPVGSMLPPPDRPPRFSSGSAGTPDTALAHTPTGNSGPSEPEPHTTTLASVAADAAASGTPSKQAGGSDGGSKAWKPPAAMGLRISCSGSGSAPAVLVRDGSSEVTKGGGSASTSVTAESTAAQGPLTCESGLPSAGLHSADVAGWMNFDSLLSPAPPSCSGAAPAPPLPVPVVGTGSRAPMPPSPLSRNAPRAKGARVRDAGWGEAIGAEAVDAHVGQPLESLPDGNAAETAASLPSLGDPAQDGTTLLRSPQRSLRMSARSLS